MEVGARVLPREPLGQEPGLTPRKSHANATRPSVYKSCPYPSLPHSLSTTIPPPPSLQSHHRRRCCPAQQTIAHPRLLVHPLLRSSQLVGCWPWVGRCPVQGGLRLGDEEPVGRNKRQGEGGVVVCKRVACMLQTEPAGLGIRDTSWLGCVEGVLLCFLSFFDNQRIHYAPSSQPLTWQALPCAAGAWHSSAPRPVGCRSG